jgi:FkbM family methyltransferase
MQLLKDLIKGTPAERPARRLWLRTQSWLGREEAIIDQQAFAIMKRLLRRSSNCIDIGCAQGLYLDEMLRLAPAGRHWAFEPIPQLYEALTRRFAGRPVEFRNLALSNEEGRTQFHWNVSNPGWSGLRERAYPSADDQIELIDVELCRLDQAIPPEVRIDLIKLDVEGAELAVLEGGVELLRRCRPTVIFEYGLGSAEFYEAWPERIFDLLAGCGLGVAPLADYLAGRPPLERAAFARQFHDHVNYYFVASPPRADGG